MDQNKAAVSLVQTGKTAEIGCSENGLLWLHSASPNYRPEGEEVFSAGLTGRFQF